MEAVKRDGVSRMYKEEYPHENLEVDHDVYCPCDVLMHDVFCHG